MNLVKFIKLKLTYIKNIVRGNLKLAQEEVYINLLWKIEMLRIIS